ncbi:MAG TPA: toll/interleukin-1 receptor domain-containing protein [Candidatus Acidoferrum sp.]|nr:toll/interleukin-1 receptor domain-containing protein [Candidatus Acidoferrum sp.]
MSDIFLSYAAEDWAIAEALASALAEHGWSVWWDRKITIGQPFDAEIERELAEARCVIVLWSRASVSSEWVKTEASDARDRRVLLPALIEDVTPPLEFRRLQTVRLLGWPELSPHEGFERLVQEVAGRDIKPPRSVPPPRTGARHAWAAALLVAPTIIAALLGWMLMSWRIPTAVRLALTVKRAEFTLAPADPPLARILDSTPFTAITVERFAVVSIEANAVEAADPARYDLAMDRFPESAWRKVAAVDNVVEFRAADGLRLPALTLEPTASRAGVLGTLRPITVPAPSAVTLETAGAASRSFTLTLTHPQPLLRLPMSDVIKVMATDTTVTGLAEPAGPPSQARTWRIEMRKDGAPVEVKGKTGLLVVSITLPPGPASEPVTLFADGTVPITAIDFTHQDDLGRRVSAVVAEGQLSYPDRPGAPPWMVRSGDIVTLERLQRFHIRRIAVDPARRGVKLDLEGIAGRVTTQQKYASTDHRLSLLGSLTRKPGWVGFGVLAWAIPTVAGVYRLLARRALKEAKA